MKVVYAVKNIDNCSFGCVSNTPEDLEKRINRAYVLWGGLKKKGSVHTISDFMEDKVKVKLTIETIE